MLAVHLEVRVTNVPSLETALTSLSNDLGEQSHIHIIIQCAICVRYCVQLVVTSKETYSLIIWWRTHEDLPTFCHPFQSVTFDSSCCTLAFDL